MAIPRSMGWLVVTGAVVLLLVGLSMFALDRPDVAWSDAKPHCPHCRTLVPDFSRRCPACREEFDWMPASDDASPRCVHCLTPAQDDFVRERRRALGEDPAAARIAKAAGLRPDAALAYVHAVGRGQCGWCGGTGLDLAKPLAEKAPCPVCFGERRCIACDGDRRVKVGSEPSSVAFARYADEIRTLRARHTPAEIALREARVATQEFLRRNVGTVEARELIFWPRLADGPDTSGTPERAVDVALSRLEAVMSALAGD